ncbi:MULTISPECIES: phage holin family protein [unclassified Luteococcus]|uniref:phage holin family protein n=1 Tax=unclassified Luteococcus TaxID=2639923 RepID=UPI00313ECC4F
MSTPLAQPPVGGSQDDRSIGEIVGDLSQNFSTLVHQELELAKAELKQDAGRAGKGAGMLAGAGITAHLALLFASLGLWWTIAILIGNHDHPALGWSGLILAVLWGVIATVLGLTGKKSLQEVNGLPQTTETAKQIPDALKGHEERNR